MTGRGSLAALLLASSLTASAAESLPRGEVVDGVESRTTAGQSYALYLPRGYRPERPAPVLYCFDPRERGALCVELFREAAEDLGWIVAGSNNMRSDGPIEPSLAAMKAVWIDTHERLAIDDRRTYAAGFSGGARIANLMGQLLGFTGVVAVGAGFPPSAPPRQGLPFDFHALVGLEDFNYYEVTALPPTLEALDIETRLEVFDGAHEWCPPSRCGAALEWLELRAMARGLVESDPPWIRGQLRQRLSHAEALESSGSADRALAEYQAIVRDFEGSGETAKAALAVRRLTDDPASARARRAKAKWDRQAREYLERLPDLLARITSPDGVPSGQRALEADLELRRWTRWEAGPDADERTLAARRLMSMVFVQTGQIQVVPLLEAGRDDRAALLLAIAAEIRPESPAVWYNLGCALARSGRDDRAFEALSLAVELGFDDRALIEGDRDLESLRGDPRFDALLARLDEASD